MILEISFHGNLAMLFLGHDEMVKCHGEECYTEEQGCLPHGSQEAGGKEGGLEEEKKRCTVRENVQKRRDYSAYITSFKVCLNLPSHLARLTS